MIRLSEKIQGIPYFSVKLGNVTPTEMFIRYTFEDDSKKYLVFAKSYNSNVFYLREYVGNLSDHKYYCVNDMEVVQQIHNIIKRLHTQPPKIPT